MNYIKATFKKMRVLGKILKLINCEFRKGNYSVANNLLLRYERIKEKI